MDELIQSYRQGLLARIDALEALGRRVQDPDPHAIASIRALAHMLRGSGASYGFPAISEAATAVELAPEATLPQQAERLVEVLRGIAEEEAQPSARVLLIDADADAAERLATHLTAAGREVLRAHSAAEVDAHLGTVLSLIVCDPALPDRDARYFLAGLLDEAGAADIPVIVMASGSEGLGEVEAFALGADAYLRKPVEPEAVAALVAARLRRGTLRVLTDAFELVPAARYPTAELETVAVGGCYQSRRHPNLWVIDKANGGRADALNAGLNFCRTPLFCIIDADSLLERDALVRVVRPFLEDVNTVGAGGIIRIANGCVVENGMVSSVRLPRSFLARLQVVEYLRSFLAGRVGWNSLGATFIISGAFGIWRRSLVVEAGGYDPNTVGEDMELTVRMHRFCRERKIPYRITFIPDPVLWTEVPETLRDLGRQRDRWQRGLIELLTRHRRMLGNPRYGKVGVIAYPYLYFLEMLGPVVEFLGYFAIVYAVVAGIASTLWLVAFLILALVFGVAVSIAAVALEELCFRRYSRFSDLLRLFVVAVLENFGLRQLLTFYKEYGFWAYFRGKKGWGGSLTRKGFATPSGPLDPAVLSESKR